jgi:Rieske Fe-S protein
MPHTSPGPSRRTFLKILTATVGGLIGAVFAVPGLRAVVYPARRRIVDSPDDFLPVAMASAVGTKPLRVEVVASAQRDAWMRAENVRLGAAWLVRDGDRVRAFTATCPHLGCAVDFDAPSGHFRCPCHTSAFSLSGARLDGPAKRGLDPLEARVDEQGRVAVRFRRFKQDIASREEV